MQVAWPLSPRLDYASGTGSSAARVFMLDAGRHTGAPLACPAWHAASQPDGCAGARSTPRTSSSWRSWTSWRRGRTACASRRPLPSGAEAARCPPSLTHILLSASLDSVAWACRRPSQTPVVCWADVEHLTTVALDGLFLIDNSCTIVCMHGQGATHRQGPHARASLGARAGMHRCTQPPCTCGGQAGPFLHQVVRVLSSGRGLAGRPVLGI